MPGPITGGGGDDSTLNADNLTSGTVPDARFPATLPVVSGLNLTAINASNLGSGTVPDERFPAILPAASGANLTALNASNLGSGTIPDARFPATLPAASGLNLTALNASNIGSGTVPDARFPATLPAASGLNLTAINASNLGSGTIPDARFPATLPAISGANLTGLTGASITAANVWTQLQTFDGGIRAAGNSLGVRDSDASHTMNIGCASNLSSDRALSFVPGDATRTITLTGSPTLDQDVSTAGSPTFVSETLGTSGNLIFGTRSRLSSPADGNFIIASNGAAGFGLLILGQATTSFPAIKRSSTVLAIRLGNDSADAPMSAAAGTFSGAVTIGSGTAVAKSATYTGVLTTVTPASGVITAGAVATSTLTATGVAAGDTFSLELPLQEAGITFMGIRGGTDQILIDWFNADLLASHTLTGTAKIRSFEV